MDASTEGNAQANPAPGDSRGRHSWMPAHIVAHHQSEAFISAVTHPFGNAHRVCVADDCRKVAL